MEAAVMDELKKLKVRLAKKLEILETSRIAFDLEGRDFLLDEIQDIQEQIAEMEQGKA